MATLEERARALMPLIGKGFAVSQRKLKKSDVKEVDYLGINTLVVDIKGGSITIPGIRVQPGVLVKSNIVDLDQYGLTDRHLKHADLGGQGNIVPIVKKILGENSSVGVMGNMGNDSFSQYFKDNMARLGINTYGLMNWRQIPIGVSVMTQGVGERSGIIYFYRANGMFDGDNTARERILHLNPTITHNSYIGLSPQGWDRENGNKAADFLRWQQNLGILTITDTHTFGSEEDVVDRVKMPEYDQLKAPLSYTNIFICSLSEAKRIMNAWEIKYDQDADKSTLAHNFIDNITAMYFDESDQPRIFGVSMRDRVILQYQDRNHKSKRRSIPSNYSEIAGVDLVGAGDSLKASLGSYIVKNLGAFNDGSFSLSHAGQFAQLGATLYVATSNKKTDIARFDNIAGYERMQAVARSDETYSKLRPLLKTLNG